MAWQDVKLSEVKPESGYPAFEQGEFTFALNPGAATRINNFGTEELVLSATAVEGPNTGQRIFLQYPDPNSVNDKTGKKATWSAQALKKLEIALGVEQEENETPVAFLNRVASNGHSHFKITMGPSNKVRNGETEPRVEPKLFSVGPAA